MKQDGREKYDKQRDENGGHAGREGPDGPAVIPSISCHVAVRLLLANV